MIKDDEHIHEIFEEFEFDFEKLDPNLPPTYNLNKGYFGQPISILELTWRAIVLKKLKDEKNKNCQQNLCLRTHSNDDMAVMQEIGENMVSPQETIEE